MASDVEASKGLVSEIANKISSTLNADIILYCDGMERRIADNLIDAISERNRKRNVFLIMITAGGDASAAYRIARCLQEYYERYIAFIPSYCKSAGTLCVLGANEIVMGNSGELGPLDVQLYKRDEIGELNSGLVTYEALEVLEDKAFQIFEKYFLSIKANSEGLITFRTATEIASKMTIGLMEPIYKQIDPFHIGEVARSLNIAMAYGLRLMGRSKNFNKTTLERLSKAYPSHSFVIDRSEAKSLFTNIRVPTEDERKISQFLFKSKYVSNIKEFIFLSDEESKGDKNGNKTKNTAQSTAKPTSTEKTRRGRNPKRNGKNT